jgi:hypothetical protein
MNTGPRKQLAPFRPVDTLSSPQKPSFNPAQEDTTDDEKSYLAQEGSSSLLGNSTGLFDEDSFHASPQYVSKSHPAAAEAELRPRAGKHDRRG